MILKNWHNFKNCSNELINIVKDKNQIKNSYNGDWGSINIKGKKYNHHYFGSVIKPKKTYKKSQNGLIRHGMGIFTKKELESILMKFTVDYSLMTNYK